MDENTARSMLGLTSQQLLTSGRVEVAYAAAREPTSEVLTTRSDGAAYHARSLRLDEARALLLNRANRLPPRGDALVVLTVIQFFLGGFVLFATALALVVGSTTDYDTVLSMVGLPIAALVVAVPSMLIVLVAGLPLRLVPALRARWLRNGEITVAGVVIGLIASIFVIAVAPMIPVDQIDLYEARDINRWAQFGAWFLFAFSVAHFVWPLRWVRRV